MCLWAVHGATELGVFTVVAFCTAWNGGGVVAEMNRLVCNCFPDPGGGLPAGTWPGTIQVSRSK